MGLILLRIITLFGMAMVNTAGLADHNHCDGASAANVGVEPQLSSRTPRVARVYKRCHVWLSGAGVWWHLWGSSLAVCW